MAKRKPKDKRQKLIDSFVKKAATPDQQDRARGAIGRGPDLRGLSERYRLDQRRQDRR